jgi:hypothetical protein
MDADFNERIRVLKLLDRQSETYIDKSKIILEVTVFKIGWISSHGLPNPNFEWPLVQLGMPKGFSPTKHTSKKILGPNILVKFRYPE